jgi:hypothetical protein
MSTIYWVGDAAAIAQVDTYTVGGTIEVGDKFNLTVGNKTLTVSATSTSAETVAQAIVTAWNNLTTSNAPEFAEITAAHTSGGEFTLTADTPGKPFTVSVETTESDDGAADDQTFTGSTTTASAGPADASTVTNYSGGALPSNGDILIFENSSKSVLYGLDALSGVTLSVLEVRQSYTGWIGLPRTNGTGTNSYSEYRDQYLQVGATSWWIGSGDGSGSGRIKIDFGSVQYTGAVLNSGSSSEAYIPSVLLKGTHASNSLMVLKGTVGVAFFAGETSTLSEVKIGYVSSVLGDANVQLGDGVTLTTVTKAGGNLSLSSNVTTLTQYDGQTNISGSATIGTANVDGTLVDRSSGTFTNVTLTGKGVYDNKSLTAKTITNLTMYANTTYKDPYDFVTLTNGIVLSGCKPSQVTIDITTGKTLSI